MSKKADLSWAAAYTKKANWLNNEQKTDANKVSKTIKELLAKNLEDTNKCVFRIQMITEEFEISLQTYKKNLTSVVDGQRELMENLEQQEKNLGDLPPLMVGVAQLAIENSETQFQTLNTMWELDEHLFEYLKLNFAVILDEDDEELLALFLKEVASGVIDAFADLNPCVKLFLIAAKAANAVVKAAKERSNSAHAYLHSLECYQEAIKAWADAADQFLVSLKLRNLPTSTILPEA